MNNNLILIKKLALQLGYKVEESSILKYKVTSGNKTIGFFNEAVFDCGFSAVTPNALIIAKKAGLLLLGCGIKSKRPVEHWKTQYWVRNNIIPSYEQDELKAYKGQRKLPIGELPILDIPILPLYPAW